MKVISIGLSTTVQARNSSYSEYDHNAIHYEGVREEYLYNHIFLSPTKERFTFILELKYLWGTMLSKRRKDPFS